MKIEVCDIESEFQKLFDYTRKEVNKGRNIVLLNGDLGAGKTTFVKHYLKGMGSFTDEADSPTFSIVNTYKSDSSEIFHFDLYRLKSVEEIEDIGFMEYIDSGKLCFIEWPDKIAEFLPSERILNVQISLSSQGCREYIFS